MARGYFPHDAQEAEDVAQEAVLRAWRRLGGLRDVARKREWLAAIARNEALRHHARRRPEPVDTTDADDGQEDERVLGVTEHADLAAAVSRLEARDRLILSLRYGDDLTQRAIAARLGLPEGTVKVRLHRAREKLRIALRGSR